jgi:hypothetical protein
MVPKETLDYKAYLGFRKSNHLVEAMHACEQACLPSKSFQRSSNRACNSEWFFLFIFSSSRKPENPVDHRRKSLALVMSQHSMMMRFRNDCEPPQPASRPIWHSSTDGIELEVCPNHGDEAHRVTMPLAWQRSKVGRSIEAHRPRAHAYKHGQIDAYRDRSTAWTDVQVCASID